MTGLLRTWFIISGHKDLALLLVTEFLENGPMLSTNCIVVMCLRGGHQLPGARLLFATLLTEFEYFALSGRKLCIVFACLSRWEHQHSTARNSTCVPSNQGCDCILGLLQRLHS